MPKTNRFKLCPFHATSILFPMCTEGFKGCEVEKVRAKKGKNAPRVLTDIPDDIAKLKVSRQRKLQLTWKRLGRCTVCGKPRWKDSKAWCFKHLVQKREAQRRTKGNLRRNLGSASYREEIRKKVKRKKKGGEE